MGVHMKAEVAKDHFCHRTGNRLLLEDGNKFGEFLSNTDFYLTARDPVIQAELISGYIDCLPAFWRFGKMSLFWT